MQPLPKAILVLSGGQDSTTCGFLYRDTFELHALTVDYGQRHSRELDAARDIGVRLNVATHEVLHVGSILEGTSPLLDKNAELAQYADPHSLPGGLEKTFVPMRNQLFLTLAANRAYVLGADTIITGVCQEDFGGYPDCRRDFIDALERASSLGTFTGTDGAPGPLRILTPLMHLTKADTVRMAYDLAGCYEALAYTQTGYDGAYPPTGHDHATLLRAKGFEEAGIPDPLVLRAWFDGAMELPKTDNYSWEAMTEYATKRFPWMRGKAAQELLP